MQNLAAHRLRTTGVYRDMQYIYAYDRVEISINLLILKEKHS
jgi:hypothetical protein